jgi:hypothetical protein
MSRHYLQTAAVAGRYAARESERLQSEAEQKKAQRQAAMATLLNQAPIDRVRCAAGLISVVGLSVEGELFGEVQQIWNRLTDLEAKLTKAQGVTTRG